MCVEPIGIYNDAGILKMKEKYPSNKLSCPYLKNVI